MAEFCLQLFPLLIAHSDDYGRFAGDGETVKLICDPGSPRSFEEFSEALGLCESVGLIERYESCGTPWLQIVKFDEHQPGLLSKRTKPISPAPPSHTEVAGNSSPTEPNLTKPNQTKPNLTELKLRGSPSDPPTATGADAVVSVWNELVTAPIPQVTKVTPERRSKINARLKAYPDLTLWRTVIAWLNEQDWCRAPGTGKHPSWTASLDWLVGSESVFQRYLERATTPVAAHASSISAQGQANAAAMQRAADRIREREK